MMMPVKLIMTEELKETSVLVKLHAEKFSVENGCEFEVDVPSDTNMDILNDLLTHTFTIFVEDDENFDDILDIVEYFQLNNVILTLHYFMSLDEYDPAYNGVSKNIFLHGDDDGMYAEFPIRSATDVDLCVVDIPPNTKYFDCTGCLHVNKVIGSATYMILNKTGIVSPVHIPEGVLLFSCNFCHEPIHFTGFAPFMDFGYTININAPEYNRREAYIREPITHKCYHPINPIPITRLEPRMPARNLPRSDVWSLRVPTCTPFPNDHVSPLPTSYVPLPTSYVPSPIGYAPSIGNIPSPIRYAQSLTRGDCPISTPRFAGYLDIN